LMIENFGIHIQNDHARSKRRFGKGGKSGRYTKRAEVVRRERERAEKGISLRQKPNIIEIANCRA